MHVRTWLLIALATVCVVHREVAAQAVAAPTSTLRGVVTDSAGARLANIDVSVTQLRKRVRTGADGAFRFDSVALGTYDVIARATGFAAPSVQVVVGAAGGMVTIRMARLVRALPSMTTVADRGGLSGVIGDTAYQAMPDVTVTVQGFGTTVTTDASGAFFVPLKAGSYMVRLDRKGFARQLISVTIPENEGRRIAAWMRPQVGAGANLEASQLAEMNQRMVREQGIATKYYTRDEIDKLGVKTLRELLQRTTFGSISDDCWVYFDGIKDSLPMWALDPDELEYVEVYQESQGVGAGRARGKTSINGNAGGYGNTATSMRPGPSRACGKQRLIAWLRK